MELKTKIVTVFLMVTLIIGVHPGLGKQKQIDKSEDLYSMWLKLSMMGHNQSEIEGLLSEITDEEISLLKNRLRRDVLSTLVQLNLKSEIELSKTEQDLIMIRDKIRIEIRFSGLENDQLLQRMIRHEFGISLLDI